MTGFSLLVGSRLGRRLITRHNALARWLIPARTNRTLSPAEMAAYLGPFPTPASRLPMWIFARQIRASRDWLAQVEQGLTKLHDKPLLIVWGDADGAFRRPDRDHFASLFPDHRIVDNSSGRSPTNGREPQGDDRVGRVRIVACVGPSRLRCGHRARRACASGPNVKAPTHEEIPHRAEVRA